MGEKRKPYMMTFELDYVALGIVKKELAEFVGMDTSHLLTQQEDGTWCIKWNMRDVDDMLFIEDLNNFIHGTRISRGTFIKPKIERVRIEG